MEKSGINLYLHNVFIGISILINAITCGEAYQQLCARNWEMKRNGQINFVFFFDWLTNDKTHCLETWAKWKIAKAAVQQYEKSLINEERPSYINRL